MRSGVDGDRGVDRDRRFAVITSDKSNGRLPAVGSAQPAVCRLHALLGRVEQCPGNVCGLWDPGDGGHCAVAELDLDGRPEAAAWLLRIRKELESASTPESLEAARDHFTAACELVARTSRAVRRH